MDMHIEPEELRDSARKLLEKGVDRRAAYADTPGDGGAGLRATMAELGWMLLTTPAELDGLGQSFVALAPIYQELGRALAPVAFASTMAAAEVLVSAPDLLARIGSGEATIAIAHGDDVGIQGDRVSGTLPDVLDARAATHLLLIGADMRVVDLADSGVTLTDIPTWDRSRQLADIKLENVSAIILPANAEAAAIVRAHLDLAIACDSLGGADQALEEAIAYMGTRQQFNRPIGSFQALKHRSADLKVALEIARAFTNDAAQSFVDRREGWASIAAQAKLLASQAYRSIAEESVQFHGGIGFTWEHDCHLFLKRALLNEMLGGSPEEYKDRIAPDILRRAFAERARTRPTPGYA
jgi:alkylation response protein AidB-like acyl-CoA dehydrogenase